MNYNYKKKYGQNFINNKNILKKISSSITPTRDDLIIEIGVGIGSLTKYLLEYNTKYIGYEIDIETKSYLDKITNKIIFDDFLSRDIKKDISSINYDNLYIVGNLPYYITSPIITKILTSNLFEKGIVIMVQDEVAKRFSSRPNSKEYGYITVLLNCYYDITYLFNVSKNNFTPKPNVESAVVKLVKKTNNNINYNLLSNFLKDAFKYKRKTLKNNLSNYNLDYINNVLQEYNFSISNRAEQIPYNIYLKIISKEDKLKK